MTARLTQHNPFVVSHFKTLEGSPIVQAQCKWIAGSCKNKVYGGCLAKWSNRQPLLPKVLGSTTACMRNLSQDLAIQATGNGDTLSPQSREGDREWGHPTIFRAGEGDREWGTVLSSEQGK